MRLLLLLAALLAGGAASAAECPTAGAQVWPVPAWRVEPRPAPDVEAIAFPAEGPRTNGLVVVKDGAIVFERYAGKFGPDVPHIFWSGTKSVLHALYGRAVMEGLVDIDQSFADRSPWIGDGKMSKLTYRHLLQMSSGLSFNEAYEYAPLRSSIIAMLYTTGHDDMAHYAADRPLLAAPGTLWSYKGGDTLILSAGLRDVVGAERYTDYPWTALFDPLGMQGVVFERDGAGTFVASSYLYATARDLARLGLLYLRDGCWAGQRLLPEGWVESARSLAPALEDPPAEPFWHTWLGLGPASYGEHWWLNRKRSDGQQPYPGLPEDILVAAGHWGQMLWVVPEANLVVVRTGNDRGGRLDGEALVAAAIEAFR